MKLPSIPYLSAAFAGILRRFPFVILIALSGVVSAMVLIERIPKGANDAYEKLLMTAALGIPLLLAMKILTEKWDLRGFARWIPSILGIALLLIYYFSIDISEPGTGMATALQLMILNVAAHLAVAIAPYIDRQTSVEDFWEYNKRLLGNFIVAAFYSLIIYAGLSIAILAVDNLFNLEIDGEIYGHLFVIMAGLVNTSIFLAHFPGQYHGIAAEEGSYTTVVKYLSKFIMIPIVIIYFLILYAFSIKILVTWELPEGWVGKLVLGFSLAGILTYLLNYLIVKFDDTKLPALYRKWFFYVLLPMVGLLFVSMGRRISDYGVTEIRYIVVAMGIWLLLVCGYFILSGKDNIKFIPASLLIIALLTALGPFNAFRVSKSSQVDRLQAVLIENGMFENGKAVPPADTLSQQDAGDIRSILNYLREYDHFQAVAPWFDIGPDSVVGYETVNEIENQLNIGHYPEMGTSCFYTFPTSRLNDIAGYEHVIMLDVYTTAGRVGQGWEFAFADTGTELILYNDGAVADRFELEDQLRRITDQYECNKGNYPAEAASVEVSGNVYTMKLLLRNLSLQKNEKLKLERLEGICLLKPASNE